MTIFGNHTRNTVEKLFPYPFNGRSHWGMPPPHFNFRTKQGPKISVSNIRDIAFMDVQKLYGPEILQFLLCRLQFLENLCSLWRLFIFFNYLGVIDHFTLDLLKRTRYLTLDLLKSFFLWIIRKRPQRTSF